jgi:hypothetical protein
MICIVFYCDIEPTRKIVVQLAGEDYSLHTVLHETDVYMKLFNIASPKFGERGETNWEAHLLFCLTI